MLRTRPLLFAFALAACFSPSQAATPERSYAPADGVLDYAFLYFDYNGQDASLAQLKKGFAQMLVADTQDGTKYRVVERERVQELMDELKLNASSFIDKDTAQKIGRAVGADRIVLGSYVDYAGTFVVIPRIVDTETWVVGCTSKHTGKADQFVEMEERIAGWLRQAMATGGMDPSACPAPPAAGAAATAAQVPAVAVVELSKALDAKDAGDKEKAKAILTDVVKAEPDFKLAQDELATLLK